LSRGDLSEAEWHLLEPLLPPERGRKSRPAFDNRQIVNGIYELFRSGRAKALMDEAGFTTLLKRSLVSSDSGRGERSLAPKCSVPRRRE
jgi:hypothetical protein